VHLNTRLENIFTYKKIRGLRWPSTDLYFIAEIGINHNGDLDLALELIDIAKRAGCDAVKFQKRTIDVVYTKEELNKARESPWGNTQREQKLGLEFSKKQYDVIDTFCRQTGIDWSASAWDIESLHFVETYNPPFHKVASAFATNLNFLEVVARFGRPTFVSTGMCNESDVDEVVKIFKKFKTPLILMHSVSTYPCELEDLNLACIITMSEKYQIPIGYSGHEASVSPSIVAGALGAVAIERHITKSRSMYGSDQAASLEPAGLVNLLGALRKIPIIMGSGVKKINEKELPVANKLRYWASNK
jgi:N-acetylneuraminate synthase